MESTYKNANGDIFNANGDIFNANGDIFNAQGDIFNATGNPFAEGVTDEQVTKWYENESITQEQWDQYQAWKSENGGTKKTPGAGLFNVLDSVLNLTNKGVSVWNNYQQGQTVEQNGVEIKTNLGTPEETKSYTMYYILGGIVLVLIGVGIYVSKKKS